MGSYEATRPRKKKALERTKQAMGTSLDRGHVAAAWPRVHGLRGSRFRVWGLGFRGWFV